ncbi:MAG: hypothetical protein M3041_01755 [Acidobacteriota bacterium]|nr:hypothetical protein [Acidobacteriota bacterium]
MADHSDVRRGRLRIAAIVGAVFVPVAFCAVTNGISGWKRLMQAHTKARMRELGSAIERYAADFKYYPSKTDDLAPTYTTARGWNDEWGKPLRYECWQIDPKARGCDHYAIASAGADGKFDPEPLRKVSEGLLRNADEDIVYRDGNFVRYP